MGCLSPPCPPDLQCLNHWIAGKSGMRCYISFFIVSPKGGVAAYGQLFTESMSRR